MLNGTSGQRLDNAADLQRGHRRRHAGQRRWCASIRRGASDAAGVYWTLTDRMGSVSYVLSNMPNATGR